MDNSVKIIQWDGIKSVFLIALLSTFGFLGFLAKGLIINYVLRFAPKNRPINTLIAIDQISQLMTSLIFILMTLFSLVHGLPISVLMGQNSCLVFTLTQATHASFMTVQSTGMAAYRVLIMKFQNLVIKIHPYRLTKIILAIESVLIGTVVTLCWTAISYYKTSSPEMEFCTGLKEPVDLGQESADKGKNVLMGVIFIIQTLICTEVTMYLIIFWGLHKQNKFHTRGLSLETIKHRNKKNAITLTGQVLSFVVELCTSIIAQLLIMDNSFGILEPAALTCWIIVITSTVSVLQFMTSPELRRFYM